MQKFFNFLKYSSKTFTEYIFGCLSYESQINFIKFNSKFEIEFMLSNQEYKINNYNCFFLTILKLPNDNIYSLYISCDNQEVLFKNDLPEDLKPGGKNFLDTKSVLLTSQLIEEATFINKPTIKIINSSKVINLDSFESHNKQRKKF